VGGAAGGAAIKAALIEKEGYMINERGQECIAGYNRLGNSTKDALIEKEGYMINERGQECIAGYNRLGNLTKDALIEKEGYMINKRGQECIAGYNRLGNVTKAAHIEREGYTINEHGKQCITGLRNIGILGGAAAAKIHTAKALDEHHTHICISALCRRGVSVRWENGYAVYEHRCCDPQLSGMEGQKPKQKKGLTLQMCKKCHRTARECKGGGRCRAKCITTDHKWCQHLH